MRAEWVESELWAPDTTILFTHFSTVAVQLAEILQERYNHVDGPHGPDIAYCLGYIEMKDWRAATLWLLLKWAYRVTLKWLKVVLILQLMLYKVCN